MAKIKSKKLKRIGKMGWEKVIDFTKIKKDGVDIEEVLKRL